jgi:8-oxo-dGTP pyrophosphatase MutT (NUDIX family)
MASAPSLTELLPDGVFLGTSLVLRKAGGPPDGVSYLLYGVRAPQGEGPRQVLEVTGIGGALEDSDTSPAAGVLREALEETGCAVALLRCRETLVVRSGCDVTRVELSGVERPAAVVFRHHGTRPRQPWSDKHRGRLCVMVFAAELCAEPRPAMELPALIWLTAEQVVALAHQDMVLQDLLDSGAELVEGAPQLPRDALLRLVDSQEALVLALRDNALPFYNGLFRGILA